MPETGWQVDHECPAYTRSSEADLKVSWLLHVSECLDDRGMDLLAAHPVKSCTPLVWVVGGALEADLKVKMAGLLKGPASCQPN